ncbi:hypothetical protein V8D89_005463 [Ganoderma adspersum]
MPQSVQHEGHVPHPGQHVLHVAQSSQQFAHEPHTAQQFAHESVPQFTQQSGHEPADGVLGLPKDVPELLLQKRRLGTVSYRPMEERMGTHLQQGQPAQVPHNGQQSEQLPQFEGQRLQRPQLGQQSTHLAQSTQLPAHDPHAEQQFWQTWDQQPEQQSLQVPPEPEVGSAPNEVLVLDTHPPHGQEPQDPQPEPEQHVLQVSHPEQQVGQEPQLEQQSLHGVQFEQTLGQEPQLEQQFLHRVEQQPLEQQSPHDLQSEQQVLHASQLEQQVLQESQPEQSQFKHGRTTPAQFTPAEKGPSNTADVGRNAMSVTYLPRGIGVPPKRWRSPNHSWPPTTG